MTYAESTSRQGSFQWLPLNPYGEVKSVRAMLDRGLSEDGAAQPLGLSNHQVTARVKTLELPEHPRFIASNVGRLHPRGVRRPNA